MRVITIEEASNRGIHMRNHEMENGECRYRLIAQDGSAYIRVEASSDGGWQKSHFHEHGSELYIVQKGCAKIIIQNEKDIKYIMLTPYQSVVIHPGYSHNVWLAPFSITHTIKFGDCREEDWIVAPDLDEWIERQGDTIHF
jgi:mannose-6-phosphate isomerase-like protein (cupin superfamily)